VEGYQDGKTHNTTLSDISQFNLRRQGVVNAADFGAVGNLRYRDITYESVGIVSGADSSDGIQTALNKAGELVPSDVALEYEGRSICYIPPGRYAITRKLVVPPNVVLHSEGCLFNFLSNNDPIIQGSRHSHCSRIKVHANAKNGLVWGEQGNSQACASDLGHIEVWHVGVGYDSSKPPYQQLCGLRVHGLDFRIDRFWTKGGNVGLDIYQASDVLCNSAFLIGCSTGLRLESAEQVNVIARFDTCINAGIQLDNSTNVDIDGMAFVNSDGYGSPMQAGLIVGRYSGEKNRALKIKYFATSTGGYAAELQNCEDSEFEIGASNARLFSQRSGGGTATSHWNPTPTGALLAHDVGVNYYPTGNEGSPAAAIKYGNNLTGFINTRLSVSNGITQTEGTVAGSLTVNGRLR
jgi:hypothetical protein